MTKRKPGRPAADEEPANERVQVRVTSAQRLELRRIATDNGTGMSGVIREAVNEYVADYGERRAFKRRRR